MAESWPLARLQVLNNSGRMFMFRVKTLSARDCKFATDEIQDNKFNGDSLESAAIEKLECQCSDWLNSKWPRGCRELQHLAGIEPILSYSLRFTLSTEPSVFIDLSKKHSTSLIIFSSLDPIFCMQDCHCLIAQVEDQGQTRYQNS